MGEENLSSHPIIIIMGRSLLPSPHESYPHLHPILSLSFIALSIAASIAILSTLCASCLRKSDKSEEAKAGPTSPQTNGSAAHKKPEDDRPSTADATREVSEDDQRKQTPQDGEKVVVLDVSLSLHGPILPTVTHSESSRRKMSMNLSMKLPDGLSRIRTGRKDRGASETEDTLWKKTIILGEKCRLPSEEEEEVVDGGQKSYHPRTPRSLPPSRNNSFNPDVAVAVAAAAAAS